MPSRIEANGRDPLVISLLRLGTPTGVVAILIYLLSQGGDVITQLHDNCRATRAAIGISADAADTPRERRAAQRALKEIRC